MVQYYRGDRQRVYRSTPEVDSSNFEFVCNLRHTNGNEQKIQDVVQNHVELSQDEIRASLLELTMCVEDAIIAFCAAKILKERDALRRAAHIIVSSPFPSDAIKRDAQKHLSRRSNSIDILGLGGVKVRGANSRLKSN